MPLIPALGKWRKADLCEFEASLVYKASSRTAMAVTQRKIKTNKNQKIFSLYFPLILNTDQTTEFFLFLFFFYFFFFF